METLRILISTINEVTDFFITYEVKPGGKGGRLYTDNLTVSVKT